MESEYAVLLWAELTHFQQQYLSLKRRKPWPSLCRSCFSSLHILTRPRRNASDLLVTNAGDDMAPATLQAAQSRHADLIAPMQELLREAGAAPEASASKRHCWECVRRRLECDAAQPVCTKCRTAGIVCPGYEDKKPLKWLAPGRVTSRARKPKPKKPPAAKPFKSAAVAQRNTHSAIDQQRAALEILGTGGKISLVDFQDDVTRIVQATSYFNTRVYPALAPLNYLGPTPYLNTMDLEAIRVLPIPTSHTFVSLVICHHIYQNQPREPAELWYRFHYHRGMAIQELGRKIADDTQCVDDTTVFGILMMLCLDIMYMPPNWRPHLTAITKVVSLRGGLEGLFRSLPHLRPILTYFMIVGVMGTTTSPPQDYVIFSTDMASLVEVYGKGDYPTVLCPPPLFLALMKINLLRYHASEARQTHSAPSKEPDTILSEIFAFSPEEWGNQTPVSRDALTLIGRIYRSAVALYCILSLRASFPPEGTTRLLAVEKNLAGTLFGLLREIMANASMRLCMVWPLLVAGVAAASRSPADRAFVLAQFAVLSRALGTAFPLLAREVLKKFWASGFVDWDDCFDRPYAFLA